MKKINWQIFTSFNLLFSFIIMLLSGVVLYFKPEGSVARWLDWRFLFLTKTSWESLHTVSSFLFMIFAFIHILKVHLGNFFLYISRRNHFARRELFLALAIFAIILVGTPLHFKPFQSIYAFGNKLSENWKDTYSDPGEAISATSTLSEIASYHEVSDTVLNKKLARAGFSNVKTHFTLKQIASANEVSPKKLYASISEIQGSLPKAIANPAEDITIREAAFVLRLEVSTVLKFIEKEWNIKGIERNTKLMKICNYANVSCKKLQNKLYQLSREERIH